MITFDDFKKVELTVGKILSAEKVAETEKLLRLQVDFGIKGDTTTPQSPPLTPVVEQSSLRGKEGGEEIPPPADGVLPFTKGESERDIRQIISGIAQYFPEPRALVGRKCMFVTNIEPRTIRGLESNGMILTVSTEDGKFSLLEPNAEIPEGTRAK